MEFSRAAGGEIVTYRGARLADFARRSISRAENIGPAFFGNSYRAIRTIHFLLEMDDALGHFITYGLQGPGVDMANASKISSLFSRLPMLKELPKAQQRALASGTRECNYEAGRLIFSRGDEAHDVHVVAAGRVRLSVLNPEGRVLSFKHAEVGELFGEIGAFDGGRRMVDATAMTDVRTYTIPREALVEAVTHHPKSAHAAIGLLCGRLRAMSAQTEDIALHSIVARIARYVLSALRQSNAPLTGTATLDLHLSQAEMADLLGASRQKTNYALSSLEKLGAIKRNKTVLTCNVAQLRRIARED